MNKWFDVTDDELWNTMEFKQKAFEEEALEYQEDNKTGRCIASKAKEHAWVRNNRYRQDKRRRFLSLKPSMTTNDWYPLGRTEQAVFLNRDASRNHGFYSINHVNHLYITRRGYIEQYRGMVEWWNDGTFCEITNKNHAMGKTTNRRIRHEKIHSENDSILKYSTYKKQYGSNLLYG